MARELFDENDHEDFHAYSRGLDHAQQASSNFRSRWNQVRAGWYRASNRARQTGHVIKRAVPVVLGAVFVTFVTVDSGNDQPAQTGTSGSNGRGSSTQSPETPGSTSPGVSSEPSTGARAQQSTRSRESKRDDPSNFAVATANDLNLGETDLIASRLSVSSPTKIRSELRKGVSDTEAPELFSVLQNAADDHCVAFYEIKARSKRSFTAGGEVNMNLAGMDISAVTATERSVYGVKVLTSDEARALRTKINNHTAIATVSGAALNGAGFSNKLSPVGNRWPLDKNNGVTIITVPSGDTACGQSLN